MYNNDVSKKSAQKIMKQTGMMMSFICSCRNKKSSSPPKTPFRSYSATTPPRYGNPTPPSPGGRGSSRRGRGMGGQNGPQADADVQ